MLADRLKLLREGPRRSVCHMRPEASLRMRLFSQPLCCHLPACVYGKNILRKADSCTPRGKCYNQVLAKEQSSTYQSA